MYNKFGAKLITSYEEYVELSKKYNVPISEIILMDLNRCGIHLPNNEVRVDFRVRFKSEILDSYNSWYALPVRNEEDTPFKACDGNIYLLGYKIGTYDELRLDTCESSYQRGPHLLNLNSRSRSNCGGCKACVHNYHDFYDSTVIRDNTPLKTRDDINKFFDDKKIDVEKLVQIAVVTGLFHGEDNVLEHMTLVNDVARNRGFNGELMYFGCEVNSIEALKRLSEIDNFKLIYALDNFTRRDSLLAKTKSLITLDIAKDTLTKAKDLGIKTTISYIAGIDGLKDVVNGFTLLKDSFTSFPVINIYQIQNDNQAKILNDEARTLEYYIQSRLYLEDIFHNTGLKPKRWENYRPLWYDYYENNRVLDNSYGQLEKVKK